MSGAGFLKVAKLNKASGANIIGKAARHNRREIQAELGSSITIDPSRSHLNETLHGPATADDVAQLAKGLMAAAGFDKPRKNAVLGLEFIFSLPPDQPIDDRRYFNDCATWLAARFGGEQNILSADIHRDEAAPHCHVLLLPLVNGKMAGSDMVGNRRKLLELHQDFHRAVAARYGLSKAPARLSGGDRQAAAAAVFAKLKATSDTILRSKAWPTARETIEGNPTPWLLALGIELELPRKRLRSMTAIFTSPGKGPKQEPIPIGFPARAKADSLCSVGFSPTTPIPAPPPAPAPPPPTTPGATESYPRRRSVVARDERTADAVGNSDLPTEAERVREYDLDPALFDATTGEFRQPPAPAVRLNRVRAETWVASALNARVRHSLPQLENNQRNPADEQSQPHQD